MIGDNPDAEVAKYSADTKVESHLFFKFEDAQSRLDQKKHIMERLLSGSVVPLSSDQGELYKRVYQEWCDMDAVDYFYNATEGCTYDPETNDAYTTENTDAKYSNPVCPRNAEAGNFSNPFTLRDGTKSYSARYEDIDWGRMHMANTAPYEAAWEIVVEGREPVGENEENIKKYMGQRLAYFMNFASKEEYVAHSCAFWTYGVIVDGKYEGLDYHVSDRDWVSGFYSRYIEHMDGNPLMTIYEVRGI